MGNVNVHDVTEVTYHQSAIYTCNPPPPYIGSIYMYTVYDITMFKYKMYHVKYCSGTLCSIYA